MTQEGKNQTFKPPMFWLKAGAAAGLQDKGAAEGRGWERGSLL